MLGTAGATIPVRIPISIGEGTSPVSFQSEGLTPASDPKKVKENAKYASGLGKAISGKVKGAKANSFDVGLRIVGGRRDFAKGEKITLAVRPSRDCYVAVLDHQYTGETVLLFPNRWRRDTFASADRELTIPDDRMDFTLDVSEPFGADTIQVFACTSREELEKLIDRRSLDRGEAFATLNRGVLAEGVRGISVKRKRPAQGTGNAPVAWGQASITIYTHP